jgi:tetratricopeptide (TPR) repeat protein
MPLNAQGLDVTGAVDSVAAFDRAIAEYFALTGDPVGGLKAALARDPAFALGATAIAGFYLVGGFRSDHKEVTAALKAARAASRRASPREKLHLEAIEAWSEGRLTDAVAVLEDIMIDHPRDALALRLAQDAYFFAGAPVAMRDSVARVLPQWRDDDALTSFILGARAFGLEETGDYAKAEAVARAALAKNPGDAWAAHALAHVFEMTSRPEVGLAFLAETGPGWRDAHFMAGHNGWHGGLYLIELGRFAEVLDGFDRFTAPALVNDLTLDRVDAASLLWRLELEGVDVGGRWSAVVKAWAAHLHDHVLAFNDLHLALAVARSGDAGLADLLLSSLDAYLQEGEGDNVAVTAEVGLPLVAAMLDFAARRYGEAIERILPLRYDVIRIGGSHAQRDLVDLTLLVAAERAGEKNLARALAAERAALRPTLRWRERYGRAAL